MRPITFNSASVKSLLGLPHAATIRIGTNQNTAPTNERVPTDFKSVELIQDSQWFLDNGKSGNMTCHVWSIVNSAYLLGKKPNLDCIAELFNCANDSSKFGGLGLLDFQVAEILDKYPQFGIKLKKLDSFKGSYWAIYSRNLNDNKAIVRNNAKLIKEILDKGSGLSVMVHCNLYYSDGSRDGHTLCVSGYKVDSNGYMDVEVIDSAEGRYFIPVEFLTYALYPGYGCVACELIPLTEQHQNI